MCFLELDVINIEECVECLVKLFEEEGIIDVVVNNVGIMCDSVFKKMFY